MAKAKRGPKADQVIEQLRERLQRMRERMQERREAMAKLPRRGITITNLNKSAAKMPKEYELQTSGGRLVLEDLAAGRIEILTASAVDELLAQLKDGHNAENRTS